MKPLVAIAALLLLPLVVAQGAIARRRPVAVPAPVITHRTVTLQPSRDNTLYETPDGDQTSTNFGWIALGNESSFHTAKGFGSRESPGTVPTLLIEFDAQ